MELSNSYLAGLFDGEGCIFIATRKGKKLPGYILTCSICMTHQPLIELLCAQFNRKITVHPIDLRKPNCKRAFEFTQASDRARDFLLRVYDHLVVKKEEARIALQFQEHLNEYRYRLCHMDNEGIAKVTAYREEMRLRLKAYKKISFLGATDWNAGELGEHPMPGRLFKGATEGQYRAKQGLTTPGVCNEQVPAPKGKICSVLYGNIESEAEMTSPGIKIAGNKAA